MSIRIHHGYRAATTAFADLDDLVTAVETAVAPVRNQLDAALYASLLCEIHDRPQPPVSDIKMAALAKFRDHTRDDHPGSRTSHPHSFDLDYGHSPNTDGYLYLLVHAQRDGYFDAVTAIPGIEPYPYWTHTDQPDEICDEEWAQRRADWAWLIEARPTSAVMDRFTYRADPEPDLSFILDDKVILGNLPSRRERAWKQAQEQAANEHIEACGGIVNDRVLSTIFGVMTGPRAVELRRLIEPTLKDVTADALAR